MERSWLSIGDDLVAKVGGQEAVAAAIDGLEWIDIPEDGSLTVAFSPGYALIAARAAHTCSCSTPAPA